MEPQNTPPSTTQPTGETPQLQPAPQPVQPSNSSTTPQVMPAPVKTEKGLFKKLLLPLIIVVILIVLLVGFMFYNMQKTKSDGLKAIDNYITVLKAGDENAAHQALQGVIDKNPSQETDLAVQTGYISSLIQKSPPTRVETHFGVNDKGDKLVTAVYEIKTDNASVHYTVAVAKTNGSWVIDSAETSSQ